MDHDTRRFVRETKAEIRQLIDECESVCNCSEAHETEAFDQETEVIVRSAMGGSANLGFFLPYLWKHRH